MSNDLAIYANGTESTLKVLGKSFAESGMFGCTNEAQGVMLALQCMSERKPPLELAKTYHLIGGKLSMKADTMLAKFQQMGGRVKWLRFDDQEARANWRYQDNDLELSYSLKDAERAGLWPAKAGSNWAKFTRNMLRARLISEAIRMLAPEVNFGAYTPEEVADFDAIQVSTKYAQGAKVEAKSVEMEVVGDVVYAHSMAERVAEAIGTNEDAVNAYCVEKGHIAAGKTWRDLEEKKLGRLMAKVPEIIAAKKAVESEAIQ